MEFDHLTLREKVCQIMAPRAKDYIKYGCDSEKTPIGFVFVDGPDYQMDKESGVRSVDKVTSEFHGKVPLGVVADGVTGFGGVTATLRKARIGAANDEDLAYRCGQALAMQMIHNKIDWTSHVAYVW